MSSLYRTSSVHTHTTWCDGKNTPAEMAAAALDCGLRTLGFSGHIYTPADTSYCMSPEGTEEYRRQAENARFDARLDLAIVRAGGRSEKAVRALLDLDALQASGDPDREIGRALEQLRAESGYLFAPALPAFAAGAGTMAPAGCADPLRAAFGLE